MKSRASLVLMEQLVMLLVFALCAALCLGIFVAARDLSAEARSIDQAVLIAQNTVETIKACRGNTDELSGILEAEKKEQGLCFIEGNYLVEIKPIECDIAGLGRAEICVSLDDEELFAIDTAWQEVPG